MNSWRPVLGFEGHYEVSDTGYIRSIKRETIILAPRYDRSGYIKAALFKDGKYHPTLVHRLVAEAFLGQAPSERHQINHVDGDKTNNRADNLEWCTASESGNHAYRTGLSVSRKGSLHGRSKLTEAQVQEIRGLDGALTQRQIAARFDVTQQQVSRIMTGKRWGHLP